MWDEEPQISTNYHTVNKHNPISGHSWTEHGDITGYDVTGGGYARTTHRTLKKAQAELELRQIIVKQRARHAKIQEALCKKL